MLEANGVSKVKLFDADPNALTALANSDVEVMVMVRNEFLEGMAIKQENADNWVYNNLLDILPTGVKITSVSVGNEPFLKSRHDFDKFLAPAVANMYRALQKVELDQRIKITVSFNTDIIKPKDDPALGEFQDVWVEQIKAIAKVINETGSFFSVNVYPFFSYKETPQIDTDFIWFDNPGQGCVVFDNKTKTQYCNIMDSSLDGVVYALERIGYPNMEVVIGEAGWPSDGHPNATLALAQSYNNGLMRHLLSGKGTPHRPNRLFTFYIFDLFDQDAKSTAPGPDGHPNATLALAQSYNNGLLRHLLSGKGTPHRPNRLFTFYIFDLFDQDAKSTAPGPFERRWGVYDDYGRVKYPLDLSGGKGWKLAPIPNVVRLRNRWCLANQALYTEKGATAAVVGAQFTSKISTVCAKSEAGDFADKADCTPLMMRLSTPGLQCAAKGASQTLLANASYVLNAVYQLSGQQEAVCTDEGLGVVVTDQDPSTGSTGGSDNCTYELGLDMDAMKAYTQPSKAFSWKVLGYIAALVLVLANML
ncbi:unnamed protein product [Closterium sp. Naga37s-1]|nr:unnamed protein product [Closterium sp. Naga37s-1]